ncbi:hypothetical protein AB0H12_42565 [Actinosynnema sp. NPDC023794]
MEALGWITIDTAHRRPVTIGTLGPAGTSSEQAAGLASRRLAAADDHPRLRLFDTYEEAAGALRSGEVSHFVVANAYKSVNEFYMDTRIALAEVFVMDTPEYGLAVPDDGREVPARPVIASHPSPVPLIMQLLPDRYTAGEIKVMSSTSLAARAAVDGATDLALTTETAARLHGLRFISRTRPIRMLWSVFVAERPAGPATGKSAPERGPSVHPRP